VLGDAPARTIATITCTTADILARHTVMFAAMVKRRPTYLALDQTGGQVDATSLPCTVVGCRRSTPLGLFPDLHVH
jgi:hypothetical protein